MAVIINGDGTVTGLGPQSFKNSAGTEIATPQFMATSNGVTWNHAFTSTMPTSYTQLSGHNSFFTWTNVAGINTAGFTTSSTPGVAKYQAPLTGVYIMAFQYLVNANTTNHADSAWMITDPSDAYRSFNPWYGQTVQNTSTDFGTAGFSRSTVPNGQQSAYGCTIVVRLYEGQIIRPYIAFNAAFTAQIYGSGHNYWHGAYIGR